MRDLNVKAPYDGRVQGSRGSRSDAPSARSKGPTAADGSGGGERAAAAANRRLELTTSEVARRLGVSLGTVRRWADHGHLPTYRTPGGQRRFSAEDVEAFVASLERPGGRRPR